MAIHHETKQRELIEQLIREKISGSFEIFGVSGEGRRFGEGYETASGHVVDSQGRVFFFWMDWDERERRAYLETFEPDETDEDWQDDDEYTAARKKLGVK